MITNFKYFTYGTTPGLPVYGLYQAAMNRFLFVINDLERAHRLQALLLSRYPLTVCCISAGNNFRENIIDNKCCENWSMSNISDIFSSFNFKNSKIVIDVDELLENTQTFDWPIDNEKLWIMFCNYWLDFFDQTKECTMLFHKFDSIAMSLLNCELEYFPMQLEQQVMQLLFNGTDLELTNRAIIDLISNSVLAYRLG